MVKWCETLGLELGALPVTATPEVLLHLKGETYPSRELIERNPYGLPLDLAKVPPNVLMARYVDPVAAKMRDRGRLDAPGVGRLRRQVAGHVPARAGGARGGPRADGPRSRLQPPRVRLGPLGHPRGGGPVSPEPRKPLTVKGGMDRLPQAFAERLKGRIHYETALAAVTRPGRAGHRLRAEQGAHRDPGGAATSC